MAFRVITISRQYGCGARSIGKVLSQRLGIEYYDKELIRIIAQQSGYATEYVEEQSDYATTSALDFIPITGASVAPVPMPSLSNVHRIQRYLNELVSQLAEQQPCVIIGRSADYILSDRSDVLNVFLYADEEERVRKIMTRGEAFTEREAVERIQHFDKARSKNYKQATSRTWGDPKNYHLCLNTGVLGAECCAEVIAHIYSIASSTCD